VRENAKLVIFFHVSRCALKVGLGYQFHVVGPLVYRLLIPHLACGCCLTRLDDVQGWSPVPCSAWYFFGTAAIPLGAIESSSLCVCALVKVK